MAKIQIKNSFITSSAQITISSSLVRFSDNIRARGITGSFSGSIAGANVFVQGGNSFGTTATLGTNDNQVLVFETNNTERIRIQSDGNVGIGTTTVGALLAVNGDAFFAAKITIKGSAAGSLGNSSGLQLYQDSGTDTSYLYNYYAGSMVFGTSNVERMRILSGGNVGIGTSSPGFLLDVVSTSATPKLRIGNAGSNNGAQLILAGSNTTKNWVIANQQNVNGALEFTQTTANGGSSVDTTPSMVINSSGYIGMGITNPSAKLHIYNNTQHLQSTISGSTSINAGTFAIQIAPLARTYGANIYYPGIAFNHLLNYSSTTYNNSPQAWIGTRFLDYTGSERDALVFATKSGTGVSGTGNDIPVERMCIDYNGNLGIGTTTPTQRLDLSGSLRIRSAGTYSDPSDNAGFINYDSTGGIFTLSARSNGGNTYMAFRTSNSGTAGERMRIINDGNVGIGTTSPSYKLDVAGSVYAYNYFTLLTAATYGPSDNSAAMQVFGSTGSGGLTNTIKFVTNGSERVRIDSSGNVGIGTSSPTAKLYVVNTERILGILRAQSTPRTTFYDDTFAVNNDGGGANGFIYTSGTGGTYPLDYYGELILQAGPRTGYNNGISLVTGTTSPSVKLRVAEDGNIGIGTTSPGYKLEMTGTSTAIRVLSTTGDAYIRLTDNGVRNWDLKVVDVSDYFEVGGTTAKSLIVTGAGSVGIGDSAPAYKLDVSGSVRVYGQSGLNGGVILRSSSATQGNIRPSVGNGTVLISDDSSSSTRGLTVNNNGGVTISTANASQNIIEGQANGSQVMCLNYSGNIGLGTSSPAQKLHVVGDSIFNGLKTIQLDRTVAAAVNSYTNIGSFDIINGAHSFIVSINASISSYSVAKTYIIANQYNATGGSWRIALPISDSGPYGEDFQLLVNFDTRYCTLRIRKSSGSSYTGAYSVTILYTGYTTATFNPDATTGTDSSTLSILDSNVFTQVDGNVGIGTTSPAQKLHVSGNSRIDGIGAFGIVQSNWTSGIYGVEIGGVGNALWANGASYIELTNNGYFDSVGWKYANSAASSRYELGIGAHYWFTAASGTAGNALTWSERMRLDNNGNLGIGTTSPTANLTVYNSSTPTIDFNTGTSTSRGRISATSSDFTIAALTSSPLIFKIDSGEKMRIAAGGNVGIGTTTPNSRFEVSGSSNAAIQAIFQSNAGSSGTIGYLGGIQLGNASSNQNSQIYHNSSGDNTLTFVSNYGSGTSNKFVFAPGGTERVRFQQDGNVGIGTTSPSYKLHVNGGAANVAVGWFEKQSSTDGRIAHFTNSTATGYSSYIYIGSNPGTDWKVGKNVINSGTAGNFQITDHLDNVRFQINAADGNVGIGTTSPAYKLDVNSGGSSFALRLLGSSVDAPVIRYENTAGSGRTYHVGSTAPSSGAGAGFSVYDVTGNSARMLIDASGNLGIGTTSPIAKLHVSGSTMMMGDGGTFRPRQTIVGTKTGAASTTYTKIFSCGHTSTGIINVIAIITSAATASASATFSFANAYGLGATPNRISYVSVNSTITSIDCIYNNTGYIMSIAVTYSGATAPTLYFTAEGMGSENWAL